MQEQLSLKGTRKRHWAGWLEQVNSFYAGAEAKGLTAMKKNGAIVEEIAQGKAMAAALLEAYEDKIKHRKCPIGYPATRQSLQSDRPLGEEF